MTPRQFFEAVARNVELPWVAVAVGAVGVLCGVVAVALVVMKRPAALTWAWVTLFAATASAAVGLFARQRELASADLATRGSPQVQVLRIHRLAFEAARQGPWFGFGSSLFPLMLGALAAAGASRGRRGAMGVSAAFGLAAGAACVTALLLARGPRPPDAFDFADDDLAAWDLALAVESVASDPPAGCGMLEVALQAYWKPSDRFEWPRHLTREPPLSLAGWRQAADHCVRAALDDTEGVHWHLDTLLASPLLGDEALHARVLAATAPPVLSAVAAHLDKDSIKAVVTSHQGEFRLCYELELQNQPTLNGRLEVHFTIGGDGKITEANASGGFPAAAVTQCVLARFRALQFPTPEDGLPVEVNYPFVFTPAGSGSAH